MGSGATYKAAVLADTPVGYWRLDDGTGPAASNQVGGGGAGTYQDTFFLGARGPFDDATAAYFPLGCVVIPSPIFVSTLHFSLEWVCKLQAGQTGTYIGFIGNGTTGAGASMDASTQSGFFSEDAWHSGAIQNNVGLSRWDDGNYHHVAMTWNTGTLALFVDGNLDTFRSGLSAIDVHASSQIDLGGWAQRSPAAGVRTNGIYCEFAYYNYALSQAQASAHFQQLVQFASAPVGPPASAADIAKIDLDLTAILNAVTRTFPTT